MNAPLEITLDAKLNLAKIGLNTVIKARATKETPWLLDLLKELNEKASALLPASVVLAQSQIELVSEITKRFKGEIGEYLLVKGTLTATYATECVRTLKPMTESLSAEFKVCFAPKALLESEEYAESAEIWTDNDTWELYGYERHQIDIAEMVHEQAYLNYNYYPRIEEEKALDEAGPDDEPLQ